MIRELDPMTDLPAVEALFHAAADYVDLALALGGGWNKDTSTD